MCPPYVPTLCTPPACAQAGMDLIKRMIEIDQRNYPESLHRLFIVNAPWVLHASYAVIARWMDPHTASKIQVLGAVAEPEARTLHLPCEPTQVAPR